MHVKVREQDGQIGTQIESTDAHVVLINTTQRTMEITEVDGGMLLVRASDLLGHPVQVRNELQATDPSHALMAQTQEERTGAKEDLPGAWADAPAEERMLHAGIQGIVSKFRHQSERTGGLYPMTDSELVNSLFQYVRKFRPSTLEITDDMVEHAARSAFNRPGANRGCLWMDPKDRHQTTEATREEYRANARAAIEAALQWARLEADAPPPSLQTIRTAISSIVSARRSDDLEDGGQRRELTDAITVAVGRKLGMDVSAWARNVEPKDPDKRGFFGLGPIQERTQQDYALTNPPLGDRNKDRETVKEAAPVPPLRFGAFWDTMAELLNSGFHLVVFQAGGNVYAAVNARGDDGVTPLWLVTVSEVPLTGRAKPTSVPLYQLSNLSSFRILGTYKHEQVVPF